MLSIITTEASTTIPTPRIKPVSVIMFSVIPAKFMHRTVIIIESGTETAIIIVVFIAHKKTKRITTASKSPCHAESKSVFNVSRMLSVSSRIISSEISAGRVFSSSLIFS